MNKLLKVFFLASLGVWAGMAQGAVMTLGAFTKPVAVVDFDNFAPGNITLGDIQSQVPAAGITGLTLNCNSADDTGTYDAYAGGGNGLACNRTSDGLAVYGVGSTYAEMTSVTVELDRFITEMGFQHGDRTGVGHSFSFFSNGGLVETFSTSNFEDNLLILKSDTPFNSFTFSESVNWLVTELVFETGETGQVPAPATIFLVMLGLLGIAAKRRA